MRELLFLNKKKQRGMGVGGDNAHAPDSKKFLGAFFKKHCFAEMIIKKISFTDPEFKQCFAIRREVFVEEQKVPAEEELDEFDATAWHFLALEADIAVGTARVIFKDGGATAKITRVAVLKAARRLGVGAALMRHVENAVVAQQFVLDAQSHAVVFYERLGYAAYGEEFLEAGIPHWHMRKNASARECFT